MRRRRAAGRRRGFAGAAPGFLQAGDGGPAGGLTFPEVPSPSTTIFSCRSWLSSSESDMVSREPGPLPHPHPEVEGGRVGGGLRGRGRGGRAAVGAAPPAPVSQRRLHVSAVNHSPGAILPTSPPRRAAPPPARYVGRAPPPLRQPARTRASLASRPICGPAMGEAFELRRRVGRCSRRGSCEEEKQNISFKPGRKMGTSSIQAFYHIPVFPSPPVKGPEVNGLAGGGALTPGLRATVAMEAGSWRSGGGAGPVSGRPASRLPGAAHTGGAPGAGGGAGGRASGGAWAPPRLLRTVLPAGKRRSGLQFNGVLALPLCFDLSNHGFSRQNDRIRWFIHQASNLEQQFSKCGPGNSGGPQQSPNYLHNNTNIFFFLLFFLPFSPFSPEYQFSRGCMMYMMTLLWQLRNHVLVIRFQTFLSINFKAVMIAITYINKNSLFGVYNDFLRV